MYDLTKEADQLAAVKQNGWVFKHIENPSEAVQLAAVKQDGYAIEDIKNPSEAVQLAAVKQVGHAVVYIENPSEAVQLAAARNIYPVLKLQDGTIKIDCWKPKTKEELLSFSYKDVSDHFPDEKTFNIFREEIKSC